MTPEYKILGNYDLVENPLTKEFIYFSTIDNRILKIIKPTVYCRESEDL